MQRRIDCLFCLDVSYFRKICQNLENPKRLLRRNEDLTLNPKQDENLKKQDVDYSPRWLHLISRNVCGASESDGKQGILEEYTSVPLERQQQMFKILMLEKNPKGS